MSSIHLATGKNIYKSSAYLARMGALLFFMRFSTSVITAQIIITNANKSEYVTMAPTPFIMSGSWYIAPSTLLVMTLLILNLL